MSASLGNTEPDRTQSSLDVDDGNFSNFSGNKFTAAYDRSERILFKYIAQDQIKEVTLLLSEMALPDDRTVISLWIVDKDTDDDRPRLDASPQEIAVLDAIKSKAELNEFYTLTIHGASQPQVSDSVHPEFLAHDQTVFFIAYHSEMFDALYKYISNLGSTARPLPIAETQAEIPVTEKDIEAPSVIQVGPSGTVPRASAREKVSPAQGAANIHGIFLGAISTPDELGFFIGLNDKLLKVILKSGADFQETAEQMLKVARKFLKKNGLENAGKRIKKYEDTLISHIVASLGTVSIPGVSDSSDA